MAITKNRVKLADDSASTGKSVRLYEKDSGLASPDHAHGFVIEHPDKTVDLQAETANATPAGGAVGVVVRVAGAVNPVQQVTVVDALDAVADTVVVPLTGQSLVSTYITGTATGFFGVFEATIDGANWFSLFGWQPNSATPTLGSTGVGGTVPLNFNVSGYVAFRIRCVTIASGSETVTLIASPGTNSVVMLAPVQLSKDFGRNLSNLFMAAPVVTTGASALVSLTGYKSGAAVAATTTPAVVTAGKKYRLTTLSITYIASATPGEVKVELRANTGGVVAIGSPLVMSWVVGTGTPGTAGSSQTVNITLPEGMEFAGGTGIGISVVGQDPTGAAAATGYVQVSMCGFEY